MSFLCTLLSPTLIVLLSVKGIHITSGHFATDPFFSVWNFFPACSDNYTGRLHSRRHQDVLVPAQKLLSLQAACLAVRMAAARGLHTAPAADHVQDHAANVRQSDGQSIGTWKRSWVIRRWKSSGYTRLVFHRSCLQGQSFSLIYFSSSHRKDVT